VKRVIAFQVEQMMKEQNLTKTEMSRRMNTSRAALERLLDPANHPLRSRHWNGAAKALGRRLQITLA